MHRTVHIILQHIDSIVSGGLARGLHLTIIRVYATDLGVSMDRAVSQAMSIRDLSIYNKIGLNQMEGGVE